MSQKNTCLICLEDFSNSAVLHSCACSSAFCSTCLLSWIEASLRSSFSASENISIKCANEFCKKEIPLSDYRSILDQESKGKLDEVLLLRYLQRSEDVRNCPSSDCKYYGFIGEYSCDDNYQCLSCGKLWENFRSLNRKRRFWPQNDVFSSIYQEIFTKSCPKCGIHIYRTGGCTHMTCKKCGYEFCWTCKQDFKTHLSNLCLINRFLSIFLVLFHLFLVLWIFGYLDSIIFVSSLCLHFLLKFVLFYNGFFALSAYFLHYLSHSYKYRYDVRRNQGIFGMYTLCGMVAYCLLLLFIYGNFIEFFVFIITEIVLLFVGIGVGFCFNLIWGRWLYNVE